MLNENENTMNNGEANNFGLPEGYFQKSAQSIMNKLHWQDEHEDFKQLSQLKNKHIFAVPTRYFERKKQSLELLDYPTLLKLKNTGSGFQLPAHYFEDLEVALLSKGINEQELVMEGLPTEPGFITPKNYFEQNSASLHQQVSAQKNAKVISLFSARTVMAAAVLLITLGWWGYNKFVDINVAEDCGTIACIDRVELLNTRVIENLETEDLYELVNSKDLEKKLNAPDQNHFKKTDSAADLNEEAMDDLLDGI